MKRTILLLCFAVWSISLVGAYYFGSTGQELEPIQPDAVKEAADSDSANEAKASAGTGPGAQATLHAFLDGKGATLAEALQGIPKLTTKETQNLLNEAFALPKSDPNRTRLIRELLGQLAETEPMAALELASGIESMRDSERARISVLKVWGRNDPSAAIAWANNALAGEPTRVRAAQLTAIYEGYARNNPQAAFQQALALDENNRLKNRILGEVIETQIESGGLLAAKLAIDLISDPDTQSALRRELVNEWAEFDPTAAADYVLSLGEDATTNLKNALVSEWAESDPAAAAAWLSSLSEDDPAIARASAAVIQEWTRYDLAAPAEWLNTLPASPELDRAVISYTFRAAEEDPGTAMTWAESIEDDRRRTWMMERVAGTWRQQDPETFNAYLHDSDFTQEQIEALQKAEPMRGGRGPRRFR